METEEKKWRVAARYEMKLLRRDWSFVFLVLVVLVGGGILQTITLGRPNEDNWAERALPSLVPYANAYLLYFIQLFFTLFLAGRFLFERRANGTLESTRVRPYTNGELWWGRVLGFWGVMLLVNVALMLEALWIHVTMSSAPFALWPYLFYFFTLTFPTLVFATGLTLLVKSVVRNQALAIVVLGVIFYLDVVHAPHILHGTLDLLASTLPNTFSEWTGFSGLSDYLLQRLAFLLVGLGLLCWGVRLQRRLDDCPAPRVNPLVWGTMCVLAGLLSGWGYYHAFASLQAERETARSLFVQHENHLKAEVADHHLRFQQHGETFTAESRLTLTNPHKEALPSVVLYLNPGLTVQQITSGYRPVRFNREGQILLLEESLPAGDTLHVQLTYSGGLTPAVCYAEFASPADFPDIQRHSFFRYGQELFFLGEDFTLLTPEVLWYPVSQPTVHVLSGHSTPKRFTRFTLEVEGEPERVVISQGTPERTGSTVRFTNRYPLTGLSLCMGRHYVRHADTFDGITAELYHFRGHEWYLQEVQNSERLKKAIQKALNKIHYPFDKLALVEVPVHFAWYPREWTEQVEALQPELIFRPEREAMSGNSPAFDSSKYKIQGYSIIKNERIPILNRDPEGTWVMRYIDHNLGTQTPFTRDNLFTKRWTRKPRRSPQRKNTRINLYQEFPLPQLESAEFKRINQVCDQLFRVLSNFTSSTSSIGHSTDHSQAKVANYLQTNSLQEALQDPAADVNSCLKWKIMELSSQLQTQFLVKKLDKFLQAYKAKHRFERASFEDFCLEWQKESGIDLVSLVREWYQAKGVPCYWVRDVKHERTVDDAGRELVLSSFKVWNRSNRNGVIYLEARLSNQKMFLIPANSAREIRMVSRRNEYNYFNNISLRFGLSHNFPEIQTFTLSENLPQGHLYEEGCFEIDTTAFTPDPQEIIVEDNSESFRINNESTLKKMVQGEQQLQLKTMLHYPGTWTPFFHGSAHGDGEKTYYLKLWEAGGKDVEWQAELPEAGEYELFVFTNYDFYDKVWYAIPAGPDSPKLKEYQTRAQKNAYAQTYLVSHENGNEEVIIEMDRNGDGWVSLGKYRFPKGANKLTLIDKGAYVGQYLYADAVKWVRTK